MNILCFWHAYYRKILWSSFRSGFMYVYKTVVRVYVKIFVLLITLHIHLSVKKNIYPSIHPSIHPSKMCNCSYFEIDQEMDVISLIIVIVYGVCRIVILSFSSDAYFIYVKTRWYLYMQCQNDLTTATVNCIPYDSMWHFAIFQYVGIEMIE